MIRTRDVSKRYDETVAVDGRLAEGENVLAMTPVGSAVGLPILHLKHVGAGFLAHLAFPPSVSKMPKSVRGDPKFWKRFDAALPRGGFPIVVEEISDSQVGGDYSALFLLGGYYVVYALGLSMGLFLFARRRQHRRRMWLQIGIVPVLFLGFVPLLIRAANSQQSLCEYTEIAYFHAGSTRGVAAGCVQVNSSGKRFHAMKVKGQAPALFRSSNGGSRFRQYWRQDSNVSRLRPVDLTVIDEGEWKFDLEITPWTAGEIFVYDSSTIDEAITGSARERRGRLEVQVDVPESLRQREMFIIVELADGTISSPVTANAIGRLKFATAVGNRRRSNRMNTRTPRDWLSVHRGFVIRRGPRLRPAAIRSVVGRVFFAVAPPAVDGSKPPVQSEHAVFEREVTERVAKRKRRRPRRRIRREGGDYIETLDHRLLLIEIPILN